MCRTLTAAVFAAAAHWTPISTAAEGPPRRFAPTL